MVDNRRRDDMTREEWKDLIKEAFGECHPCTFSEEERVALRDLTSGVKIFKRSILLVIVGILLGAIAFAVKGIKGL